jgi:hypothetical protein
LLTCRSCHVVIYELCIFLIYLPDVTGRQTVYCSDTILNLDC